jgi:hypothetical protein
MRARNRLSSIQLLPRECGPIVRWAADELQDDKRTQTDIYGEFVSKLEALQREFRGELDFEIPSFRSFNRYSVRLDETTRYLNEAREMASAIASKFDAQGSDDVTLIAVEAIKAVALQMLTAGKKSLDPKGVMSLANAVRAASQAQSISTNRRQKIQAEFKDKVDQAVGMIEEQAEKLTPDGKEALRKIREDVYGIFK